MQLTPELVKKYIPNTLIEVDGEQSLFDKLLPFFDSAVLLLTGIVGDMDCMAEEHKDILLHVCVKKAFATAIPSLDIVVTPTGFGVVSTNTIAPASKDRVSRLIDTLHREAAELLIQFIDAARTYPEWRESVHGQRFCSTFLTLRDAVTLDPSCAADCSLLCDTYFRLAGIALRFESALAENYLGSEVMTRLKAETVRTRYIASTGATTATMENGQQTTENKIQNSTFYILNCVSSAELAYIRRHIDGDPYRCPDEHELWHSARPILAELRFYPDIYRLWQDTMAQKFKPQPFKNKTPGAFCF